MEIETLEYIHELLKKSEKTTKNALDMARENYRSAEVNGEIKIMKELKERRDNARDRHDRAAAALEDFERQEW